MPLETKVKPPAAEKADLETRPPDMVASAKRIERMPETTADELRASAAAHAAPPPPMTPEMLANAKVLWACFQGQGGGFPAYPAALMVAHLVATRPGAESMGRSEAEHWLASFGRLHPVPYFDAKNGNVLAFVASMQRSGLECVSARRYSELVSQIQG